MSGIYGIFRFDGAPVGPESLQVMRHAMAYYGPDGGGEWRDGPVGLGQLQLRVTPEDRFEAQPLTLDGMTLVAAARLDNREELMRDFGIPSAEQAATPDSRLVLEAYRRWGEDCPDHLNGDWQFAVWDSRRRTLFIARDHHGTTGLCYYHHPRFLAFASSLKGLLALPAIPGQPDFLKLAEVLSLHFGDGVRTAYKDLIRLPPAHTLQVTEKGADKRRHWYPERLPALKLPSDHDYIVHFLDIYGQAVRTRLRSESPVGVTLSGGLDSGSVTALAAPMLAAEGKRLVALTAAPCFDSAVNTEKYFGDEWDLAAATAKAAGDVVHLPVRSRGSSVLKGIERQLEICDEPYINSLNYYWIEDVLEQAKMLGIKALLTGQDGNATVSYTGTGDPWPSLRQGDLRQALAMIRLSEEAPWLAIKRRLLRPILLPALQLLHIYPRPEASPLEQQTPLDLRVARDLGLREHLQRLDAGKTEALSSTRLPAKHEQLAVLRPGLSAGGAAWHSFGAWYAMDVRDPTSDRRIIEFCLQAPDQMFRRHGKSSWLIRQAMAGRMPPEVLNCRKLGLQAADLCERVLNEREEIIAALERLEHHPIAGTYLDLAKMRDIFPLLEKGATLDTMDQCNMILLNGLSIGLFLSQF